MYCYCSICRKTAGGGGYAINIGGIHGSLSIHGEEYLKHFSAMHNNHETGEFEQSPAQRNFCSNCGTVLWVWDSRWPELVHPHASAIDTELPTPPGRNHIFLNSKASWVQVPEGDNEKQFETFDLGISLAGWHEEHGMVR